MVKLFFCTSAWNHPCKHTPISSFQRVHSSSFSKQILDASSLSILRSFVHGSLSICIAVLQGHTMAPVKRLQHSNMAMSGCHQESCVSVLIRCSQDGVQAWRRVGQSRLSAVNKYYNNNKKKSRTCVQRHNFSQEKGLRLWRPT